MNNDRNHLKNDKDKLRIKIHKYIKDKKMDLGKNNLH